MPWAGDVARNYSQPKTPGCGHTKLGQVLRFALLDSPTVIVQNVIGEHPDWDREQIKAEVLARLEKNLTLSAGGGR